MDMYLKNLQKLYENMERKGNNLFFLSQNNMDGKILTPRIPKNYFTDNGFEDNKIKRVCFASSVDKCLMGLSMNCKDKEFYVHVPVGVFKVVTPTKKQVPDSGVTGEKWICAPVKIKCIGKIRVIDDDGKPGHEFTYGDGYKAELYGWKWEYIEKY